MLFRIVAVVAVLSFSAPALAFEDDAGIEAQAEAALAVAVAEPVHLDPAHPAANVVLEEIQPLLDVAQGKVVGIFASIVAALLVIARLLAKYGAKLPGKAGEWFAHPAATWVLPIALSLLGAMFSALAAGAPVTVWLVVGAVMTGLAGGSYNKQAVLEHAVKKGEVAKAEVKDVSSAAEALKRL